jgi:hypothetical protein
MGRYSDNPAGRLHSVLIQLPSGPEETMRKLSGREAWSQVLGFDKDDTVALYRAIGLLLEQLDKAEKLIRDMKDLDHDLYLASFDALRRGIAAPSMNSGWSDQLRYLTPVALRELAFCGSKIAETYSEGVIEEGELARLAQEANELFEVINQTSLNPDLRELLLDLVETMRRAIAEYRIRGVGGLREALSKGVGVIIMASRAEKVEEQSTVNRVFGFLARVDQLVAQLAKYKPVLVSIGRKLLPGLQDGDT